MENQKAWPHLTKKYVWAVLDEMVHNYYFSRNCPRVCWMLGPSTTEEGKKIFRTYGNYRSIIHVEEAWKSEIQKCKLYIYSFNNSNFYPVDYSAGYYVSEKAEKPIKKEEVTNALERLEQAGVLVKFVEDLEEYRKNSVKLGYRFSNIRMKFMNTKSKQQKKQVRIIEVVPHNPNWKEEYRKEAIKIKNILDKEVVSIHHIGSTSIPGIYAKPVIDIMVEVKDIENIDRYNKQMESLGYIARGEYGIKGRRFFLKGLYNRSHHIHIFEKGNDEIKKHLNFRNYMIAHPHEAKQHGNLKKELAIKYKYDNEGYCEGKNEFIKNIDKKAKEWIGEK